MEAQMIQKVDAILLCAFAVACMAVAAMVIIVSISPLGKVIKWLYEPNNTV